MTEPRNPRRLWQFQVKHLLGLLTAAAVILAIAAPQFRKLDGAAQLRVAARTGVVLIAVLVMLVFIISKRQKNEQAAGPLVERFERMSSRLAHYALLAMFVSAYAGTTWVEFLRPPMTYEYFTPPGSPVLLFLAVNYIVVRVWWGIDPMGFEVCQHGLILGGFTFLRWDEIARYSWSGDPPRQLNLFLTRRMVMNLKVDAGHVDRLDAHLAVHVVDTPAAAPVP